MGNALHELRDGLFHPSDLTTGPWTRDAQNGGPAAALLARVVESCAGAGPVAVFRFTVEFLRPMPLLPLRLEAEPMEASSRVDRIASRLWADGQLVARCEALRPRDAGMAVPIRLVSHEPPPLPEQAPPGAPAGPRGFHLVRPAVGEWVCLEASTRVGDGGRGLAESALRGTRGRLGRSLQSLVIDRRSAVGSR